MLQVASKSRRLAAALSQPPILLNSPRVHSLNTEAAVDAVAQSPNQCGANLRTFTSTPTFYSSAEALASNKLPGIPRGPMCSMMMSKAMFSSEASAIEGAATDDVKEVYDRMHKSVLEERTAPPNAWMWSLINKCENHEDIKLLFDILQLVRRFRLSNLRIHDNFNSNLCLEVTRACTRIGTIDFGKKALFKHNVYGLTPSVASANALLLYAKQKDDVDLMVEVMKLLKANDLPLQSGTADIVFSICYNADKWDLMSKYTKRFVMAGVTLRRTSFDTWMTFAAKKGDVDSLWKTEKLRSDSMKTHTIASAFSCAKGFLLERNPDNAAAVIQVLNQTLPDDHAQRPHILVELQKVVSEWPLEVIKRRKKDERKALASALQEDIPAMINGLLGLGVKVNVDMEDLTKASLQS